MRLSIMLLMGLCACSGLQEATTPPRLSPLSGAAAYQLSSSPPGQPVSGRLSGLSRASLWNAGPRSLLGDRRAVRAGDILTVVIQIDDKAEISNSSSRSRKGAENLSIPALLGIPQRAGVVLPGGAGLDPGIATKSTSTSAGDGSVRRKEKLTLRIAAAVTQVLPNGVLKIEGSQEVRVNYEIRDLRVSGYIRPEDISRQNEIAYDRIASARISYGGRGFISNAQQPRYGQRFLDNVLPF